MKVRTAFPQIWFGYANWVGSGTKRQSGSYTSLRRRALSLNRSVTFCPFSSDNFKPKMKQDQN